MVITFWIPGAAPVKRRARHGQGRTFTDARTAADERRVAMEGLVARQAAGLHAPAAGRCTLHVEHRHCGRAHLPDVSNVLKAVEDALNGVVWADDRQIDRASVERVEVATPADAGVHVTAEVEG